MADDELAEKIAILAGRTQAKLETARYPDPDLIRENRQAYWALLDVLRIHSVHGLDMDVELCPAHATALSDPRECPDCRVTEWRGCDRCRDEHGHPVRLENCLERQAVERAFTQAGADEAGDGGS